MGAMAGKKRDNPGAGEHSRDIYFRTFEEEPS
jgi:hypothetical protein